MRWYLAHNGKTTGPFEESDLSAAVHAGGVASNAKVCAEGTEQWVRLQASPFAASSTTSVNQKAGASRWAIMTATSTALTLLAVCGGIWELWRLHIATEAKLIDVTTELRALDAQMNSMNASGQWVAEDELDNSCYTDRTNVTCTFTNVRDRAVTTCARGVLRQKEASGVKLNSVTMCTGKLLPTETKTVVAPWVGGFADDICSRQTSYGSTLDWSKCVFTTEPIDVPTVRRIAAATAAK